MIKYAYVLYNSRTCVTGRALWEKLKAARVGGYVWRRSSDGNFGKTPSLILRWGNAMRLEGDFVDYNPRDAVRLASSKGEMMKVLSENEEIPTPSVVFNTGTQVLARHDAMDSIATADGYAYIRDKNDKVRYSNMVLPGDKYALKSINKESEYRVHVFDGKTIGVYRKVPHNADVRLYKNDTCDFVRLDQADKDKMRGIRGVRPAAIKATEAMGLKYSGVDVLRESNGDVYVNEVNSAPSLNEPNLDRWVNTITESLRQMTVEEATGEATINAEVATRDRLAAEAEAERLREQERIAQQRLEAERAEAERIRLEAERRETARTELYEFFRAEAERRGFSLDEVLRS